MLSGRRRRRGKRKIEDRPREEAGRKGREKMDEVSLREEGGVEKGEKKIRRAEGEGEKGKSRSDLNNNADNFGNL